MFMYSYHTNLNLLQMYNDKECVQTKTEDKKSGFY